MKPKSLFLGLLLVGLSGSAQAQFSMDLFKIGGGGGTSTGGTFTVAGTMGQPDAGEASGGPFSLMGGFWPVTETQLPDSPLLSIAKAGQAIVVSWPKPADGFVLDQATALASPSSSTSWLVVPAASYQTNATHIFINVPAPSGNAFYRLRKP